MHRRTIVGLLFAVSLPCGGLLQLAESRAAKPVTVFFVRHAETGPRPERKLSAEGRTRAAALHRLLHKAGITHVFSTDYARTKGTVAPIAKSLGLTVKLVDPKRQARAIRDLPAGAVALVAGHSNTLPPLISGFGPKVPDVTRRQMIVDDVHDRLFVMTLAGDDASMVELRYGEPSGRAKRLPKDPVKGPAKEPAKGPAKGPAKKLAKVDPA